MRNEFVNIAKSQIGTKETGTNNVIYNTWYYGHVVNGTTGTSEYAWCVTFECWCAYKTGILNTLIPKCNNVGTLKSWFNSRGQYYPRTSYTPQKGDLIIFKDLSHTGIVERVENGRIWTIEGNAHDKVSNNNYYLSDSYIQGYCHVKFDDNTASPINTGNATISSIQEKLNSRYGTNLKVDGKYGSKTKKAFIRSLQKELNKQFNANLIVDGVFGEKTKAKCPIIRATSRGNVSWLIQAKLICLGYSVELDGIYGQKTKKVIKEFQKNKGLIVDGICGKNTFVKLFK